MKLIVLLAYQYHTMCCSMIAIYFMEVVMGPRAADGATRSFSIAGSSLGIACDTDRAVR
ncbi:hypothetical protein [Nocardia sp. NPDC005366]|uniref:hypothetical protein n=1 Tax=Nocardia sp. NPDC005366 TaxID=3156878 RepID=UPI0033A7EE25